MAIKISDHAAGRFLMRSGIIRSDRNLPRKALNKGKRLIRENIELRVLDAMHRLEGARASFPLKNGLKAIVNNVGCMVTVINEKSKKD